MAAITANCAISLNCELTQPVKVQYIEGNMFSMDNAGNTAHVYVFYNGEPQEISGSISATVIRADGSTVAVSGAMSGNRAYVIFPQAAYAVPGVISVVIKATDGTTVTTIAAFVANVYRSSTDTIVDPGTIIPSVSALIAQIEAAVGSIPADYSALLLMLAKNYSSSKPYIVGEYAWEAGVLKRCIVPITAGETYTAAHWTDACLGDDLTALKSAIGVTDDLLFSQYNLSGETTIPFTISAGTGKWNKSSSTFESYYITKPQGVAALRIKSNSTNGSVYALLAASDSPPTHGNYPVYATGGSRVFVAANNEQVINIPADCAYIWVLKTDNSGTTIYTPELFEFANPVLKADPTLTVAGDAADAKETGDKLGEIEEYIPHNALIVDKSGLSSGKYIDTATGENWTNGLTNSSGSLYTSAAIDVSDYYGETLIIEIGSSDSHSGTRESGFCNANNVVSSVVQEKSLSYQSEGGYLKARINITDKYFFFSCSSKSHLSISVDTVGKILKDTQTETRYVATDGNDSNDGSYVSPFATINKALESGARCVAIKSGTYKQTIDLSKSKRSSLNIVNATTTGKVTLMSPDSVIAESETAVDGYTNVYSAETSKTFGENNIWIFQDGVADASTLISAGKRMPEQRGQAYRCYDTKIVKTEATVLADALTEIENSESYKWFKDGTTLYFSRPSSVSSSNPICGSFGTNLFANAGRKFSLNISGIDVKYMCFNLRYTSNSRIVDCSCMNVYGDGAFCSDGVDGLELIRCEAARAYSGTNGDGFNAHSSTDGYAFAHQTTAVLIDCWSHDNNDDGISFHERSEFTVIGGLFEQNYYGGGITPANGSHCTCIGVYARDNGEGGFLYMNATSVSEGGVGGQIKCIDCVSESNNIWASETSAGYKIKSAGNKGILIGCKAIGEDYGYYVSDNDGALTLIDCGALNCTTVKGGKTGNITVQNTTIVS